MGDTPFFPVAVSKQFCTGQVEHSPTTKQDRCQRVPVRRCEDRHDLLTCCIMANEPRFKGFLIMNPVDQPTVLEQQIPLELQE